MGFTGLFSFDFWAENVVELLCSGLAEHRNENTKSSGLTTLANDGDDYCNAENGYYYITEDEINLKGGGYAAHLMYMDFATQQEIYPGSDAGCSHNEESCTAVLSEDEFTWGSSKIFVWNDDLYILCKEYDSDGSVTMFSIGDAPKVETAPASLCCMNLDGTDRKKIYTFEDGVTLEDCIFADADSIYFVTPKSESPVFQPAGHGRSAAPEMDGA